MGKLNSILQLRLIFLRNGFDKPNGDLLRPAYITACMAKYGNRDDPARARVDVLVCALLAIPLTRSRHRRHVRAYIGDETV